LVTRTPEETYEFFTHNWCDISQHLPFLRENSRGNVVEIGTRDGASTSALLLGVKENVGGHLWSVDINPECSRIFPPDPQWTFIHGHSRDNADRILAQIPGYVDLLFIDGDHSYEMVKSDLAIYGPLAKTIMLHDVELEGAGVYQAATEYGKLEIKSGCYGLGVIRQ